MAENQSKFTEQQIAQCRQIPLSIQILGPGLDSEDVGLLKKRLDIRRGIKEAFPFSDPFFCEDENRRSGGLTEQFFKDAKDADLIIALLGRKGMGVHVELVHLQYHSELSRKLLTVYCHAEDYLRNKMLEMVVADEPPTRFYDDKDIHACNLVTQTLNNIYGYLLNPRKGKERNFG